MYCSSRKTDYTGPVVIESADTDTYVEAAAITQQLPVMLYIKRKQKTVLCHGLVIDEIAGCIVQPHCMSCCDANSSFYGKGKKLMYDRVMKSPVTRQQLSQCANSLDLDEEALEELFRFTHHVMYGTKSVVPWLRPVL